MKVFLIFMLFFIKNNANAEFYLVDRSCQTIGANLAKEETLLVDSVLSYSICEYYDGGHRIICETFNKKTKEKIADNVYFSNTDSQGLVTDYMTTNQNSRFMINSKYGKGFIMTSQVGPIEGAYIQKLCKGDLGFKSAGYSLESMVKDKSNFINYLWELITKF